MRGLIRRGLAPFFPRANHDWGGRAYSCYGRKVEEAINYRKRGANILIVHENDIWDVVG
jgi:hypothetical protein